MMKSLLFTHFEDSVKIVNVERPGPSKNQVQIKVEYSALDTGFDEVLQRTWTGSFIHKLGNPLYLGWHYAGTITEVGSDVKDFKVGDAVFGHLRHAHNTANGTLAEYIAVPFDQCAKRPSNVDAKTAAASTTEAMTALQALRDCGGLQSDEKSSKHVLVVGAGGGVGSAAVQVAKALGARVTALCSARDEKRVKSYGADVVLTREQTPDPLQQGVAQYDIIFDTPVVLSASRALKCIKAHGHYIVTLPSWGFLWGKMTSMFTGKGTHMVEVQPRSADLAIVADLMSQGKLTISIDSTYKVKDIEPALKRQRERKAGRVVIEVENGWD